MAAVRISLLLVIALLYMECCCSASIPRSYDPRMINDEMVIAPKKRPFCNAFTGCGRKRSQGPPGMPTQDLRQRQYVDDETLGSIWDSETAIDELSRQILSEAKLWEAIQEASAEIARRKQKEINFNQ